MSIKSSQSNNHGTNNALSTTAPFTYIKVVSKAEQTAALTETDLATIRSLFPRQDADAEFIRSCNSNPKLLALCNTARTRLTSLLDYEDAFKRTHAEYTADIERIRQESDMPCIAMQLHQKLATVNPIPSRQITPQHLATPTRPSPPSNDAKQTNAPSTIKPQQHRKVDNNNTTTRNGRTPIVPPGLDRPNNNRNPSTHLLRHTPQCTLGSGLEHLKTQCPLYYCFYCKLRSPGHFRKWCPKNANRGLPIGQLPSQLQSQLRYLSHAPSYDLTTLNQALGNARRFTNVKTPIRVDKRLHAPKPKKQPSNHSAHDEQDKRSDHFDYNYEEPDFGDEADYNIAGEGHF